LLALDRLAGSYDHQCEITRQELAIAEGQQRDHQARIGRPFAYDAYQAELTELRDRLKAGLSQATPEPGSTPVAELAERIKSLKAAHTIDGTPERTTARRINAEVPVTARIRRRTEASPVTEQAEPAEAPAEPSVAKTAALDCIEEPPEATHPCPEPTPAPTAKPQTAYRQHVAHGRRKDERQLSLF
jgi:hypothetical protein